ncbi:MAG: biopolymer transporter ExbD [Bdellovibrionales bacterium]|nr:biopolymer transporter ExbD [Bdellovibrionales bacterium]
MLKVPSARRRKKPGIRLNLIPVLNSIFIFIFFILISNSFFENYEIGSDVPIVSELEQTDTGTDQLALTLAIKSNEMTLSQGVPAQTIQKFERRPDGQFNYQELHAVLVNIKKNNVQENTIIFEPVDDLTYEEIVKIMDAVRVLNKTDEAIYRTNEAGVDEQLKLLFSKIIFSNLMS